MSQTASLATVADSVLSPFGYLRARKGWDLSQLARESGVSRSTLFAMTRSEWRGSRETWERLLPVLQVRVKYVVRIEDFCDIDEVERRRSETEALRKRKCAAASTQRAEREGLPIHSRPR